LRERFSAPDVEYFPAIELCAPGSVPESLYAMTFTPMYLGALYALRRRPAIPEQLKGRIPQAPVLSPSSPATTAK
jgi:hypothetical protein